MAKTSKNFRHSLQFPFKVLGLIPLDILKQTHDYPHALEAEFLVGYEASIAIPHRPVGFSKLRAILA